MGQLAEAAVQRLREQRDETLRSLLPLHDSDCRYPALTLSDEEFVQPGPNEGDWSAQQIVEHVATVEGNYREEIRGAVARGRAGAATAAG